MPSTASKACQRSRQSWRKWARASSVTAATLPEVHVHIGYARELGVVRDQNERRAGTTDRIGHGGEDRVAGRPIEISRRLVREHDRWRVHQGARNRNALLFTPERVSGSA